MPFTRRLRQRVGDAGPEPDHRRFLNAQSHGDRVGGFEADTANIARETIRVLRHDPHGIGAVSFVDPNRPRSAYAMAVEKDDDLANDFLFGPGLGNAFRSYHPYAGNLAQAIGLGLNRVEDLFTERANQPPSVSRSNTAYHAGAQVLFDTVQRRRLGRLQKSSFVLLAVGAIIDPFARGGEPFASCDSRSVPDNRDQVSMAARLDAKDGGR